MGDSFPDRVLGVLRDALGILEGGRAWTRHVNARTWQPYRLAPSVLPAGKVPEQMPGVSCEPYDRNAEAWDVNGAIVLAAMSWAHFGNAKTPSLEALDLLTESARQALWVALGAPEALGGVTAYLEGWNDDEQRTWNEIRCAFELASGPYGLPVQTARALAERAPKGTREEQALDGEAASDLADCKEGGNR